MAEQKPFHRRSQAVIHGWGETAQNVEWLVTGPRVDYERALNGSPSPQRGLLGGPWGDHPVLQIKTLVGIRWAEHSDPGARPVLGCTGNLAGTFGDTAVPAGNFCMSSDTEPHMLCSTSP